MKNDTACIASIAFWFKRYPFCFFLPSILLGHAISTLEHFAQSILSGAGSAVLFTYLAPEHTASNYSKC